MKKDIVLKDEKRGVYQITTTDERWYTLNAMTEDTNLPYYKFIPSITWITSYVYKGIEFYKWLANKGWDEAEAIKSEAGEKGSRTHSAVEKLLTGETGSMEDRYTTGGSESEIELGVDEWKAIVSFANWFNKILPDILMNEVTVISEKYNFAGTVDFVCRINGQLWIVDFKTSQYIWPSMHAQISAYKYALIEMIETGIITGIDLSEMKEAKLAVLQLGYKKNKAMYKFTPFVDKFEELFLPAQMFWKNATAGQSPKQIELPITVKLNINNKKDEQTEQDRSNLGSDSSDHTGADQPVRGEVLLDQSEGVRRESVQHTPEQRHKRVRKLETVSTSGQEV